MRDLAGGLRIRDRRGPVVLERSEGEDPWGCPLTALVETSSESLEGWEQVLQVCRIDVDALRAGLVAGTIGSAVLMEGPEGLYTADASAENAHTACEIEALVGAGPGATAIESGGVVWVPDVADDLRWRVWRRAVTGLWGAALAVPLTLDGTAGAAVIYAATPAALEPVRSRLAELAGSEDAVQRL